MSTKFLFFIFLFQIVFGIVLYSQSIDTVLEHNTVADSILFNNTDTIVKTDTVFNANDTLDVFCTCWDNLNIFPYRTGAAPKVPDSLPIVLVDSIHKFVLPVDGEILWPYGWRGRRMHKGLDIDLERGDTVLACFDGKVRYAHYNRGGFGNIVIIRHFNGLESYNAHLTKMFVKENEYVKAGQPIGTGGNTGARRASPHLHYELRWKDYPFDSQKIIDFETKALKTDTLIINDKLIKYKPTSKTGRVHIVKQGDTLSGIATRYHTSINYLCALNEIRRNGTLRIGQKIILP